jgi:hypothetical protein
MIILLIANKLYVQYLKIHMIYKYTVGSGLDGFLKANP